MKRRGEFSSQLARHFRRFVALKRGCGARYDSGELELLRFDRFLADRPTRRDSRAILADYFESLAHLTARGRANLLGVAWHALTYAAHHGARLGPLPPRPISSSRFDTVRKPRILSAAETRALLAACRMLPSPVWLPGAKSLSQLTYETLFGLLAVTGIRIGEALALDVGDVDFKEHVVTVRRGKFGKSRLLPLRASASNALRRYLRDSRRHMSISFDAPLFVSTRRRRLSQPAANGAFRTAWTIAKLEDPAGRPHDLRHSFAVKHVEAWYAEGRDVGLFLPALSTYLGHVSVENTRLYLRSNGLLLEQAALRFENTTRALDGVLS